MAVSTSVFSRCKAISVFFTCGRIVEPYTATRKWHREDTPIERLADEHGADGGGAAMAADRGGCGCVTGSDRP